MSWLSRFLPGGSPALDAEQQASLETVAALPATDLGRAHYETRYVIVNTETGPQEGGGQRLLAVGAVAINRGLIHPGDAFRADSADLWRDVPGFDFDDITYHRHVLGGEPQPTVRIAFDRPEVRNAFRPHTVDELYRVLDHARMSSDVGAVLLTGIMALVGLGYSAFYTRSLSRIAEAEKTAGGS
mgnify:CR=1 FL=1